MSYNRKIDELGRICFPIDLRKQFDLGVGSEVSFTSVNGKIIIEPVSAKCKLCGSSLVNNKSIMLCNKCIQKIKEL